MRDMTIGVLLLGVVLAGRAEQTGSVNADKPMVFDTFTPGPCSPNGQRHGGCPQGSLVRIRVVPIGGAMAGRAAFGPDGMIYLAAGDRDNRVLTDDGSARLLAQDLGTDVGKVLRLRDDGSIPPDNPLSVSQARSRKSSPTVTATSMDSHGIQRPAPSGHARSDRWVATS
jgi:hypothetical protein